MAMTSVLIYGVEKSPEPFLYQKNLQDEIAPSYPIYLNLQEAQYLPSAYAKKKPERPITSREQLMLISTFFGFPKSKLGEIFGVTRQSIYNWFDGAEPDNEHYKKIKRLADVAFKVEPQPSQPIFHIYTNEVINGYDKSLFDYLLDDDFDKNVVTRLSRTLYKMSKERWKRIDAMPKAKYGQNDQSILDYNLRFFEEERLGMR